MGVKSRRKFKNFLSTQRGVILKTVLQDAQSLPNYQTRTSFGEREHGVCCQEIQKGAQRKTMIEKLAPENENKRESDTRQVLTGDAS